jgi:hypothetical protein
MRSGREGPERRDLLEKYGDRWGQFEYCLDTGTVWSVRASIANGSRALCVVGQGAIARDTRVDTF